MITVCVGVITIELVITGQKNFRRDHAVIKVRGCDHPYSNTARDDGHREILLVQKNLT